MRLKLVEFLNEIVGGYILPLVKHIQLCIIKAAAWLKKLRKATKMDASNFPCPEIETSRRLSHVDVRWIPIHYAIYPWKLH